MPPFRSSSHHVHHSVTSTISVRSLIQCAFLAAVVVLLTWEFQADLESFTVVVRQLEKEKEQHHHHHDAKKEPAPPAQPQEDLWDNDNNEKKKTSASTNGDDDDKDDDIVDCPTFVQDVLQGRLVPNVTDPNAGRGNREQFQAYTRFPPQPDNNESSINFWVSLHHERYDQIRWGIMTKGRYYETSLEKIWRSVLSKSPIGSRILDVGANIGYYSLVSLAVGGGDSFVVDSFEPNPVNILRLCESLALNNWTHRAIRIHSVGVSNRDAILPFAPEPGFPGMSRFYPSERHPDLATKSYSLKKVVSLDSLAEREHWYDDANSSTIAILKVDVEGQEHRVLAGARKLLQSHMIQNVFMEVSVRNPEEIEHSRTGLQMLLDSSYHLVGQGNFVGPDQPVPWQHDSYLVANILDAASKPLAKQLNVWFQPTRKES